MGYQLETTALISKWNYNAFRIRCIMLILGKLTISSTIHKTSQPKKRETIRSLFSRIHAYNIKLIMQYCSFIHVQHSSSLHTLLLFSTSRIHSSIDTVISSLLSIECWEILDRHVITEISIHFCLLIIAIRNSVTYLSNCIK